METEYRNKIYDRLLSIKLDIEMQSFPNPQYINEKIGQCHAFINEVERFSIETCKDISIRQQALNNAEADYEIKLEDLLINNNDIKSLPNIRDREAKANSMLKIELKEIHEHENVLTELNNLLKAINLKNRNLSRANTDIRMMVRIMESQIKLGVAPETDSVVKSLIDEMDRVESDTDAFEDVEAEAFEEDVVDPTTGLDINDLLSSNNDSEPIKVEESIKVEDLGDDFNIDEFFDSKSEPDPDIAPPSKTKKEKEPTIEEAEKSLVDMGLIDPIPNFDETTKDPVITEDLPILEEEDWPFEKNDKENEKDSTEGAEQKIVDLDSVIDFKDQEEKGGGKQKEEIKTQKEEKTDDTQRKDRQQKEEEKIEIDMDDYLDSITT